MEPTRIKLLYICGTIFCVLFMIIADVTCDEDPELTTTIDAPLEPDASEASSTLPEEEASLPPSDSELESLWSPQEPEESTNLPSVDIISVPGWLVGPVELDNENTPADAERESQNEIPDTENTMPNQEWTYFFESEKEMNDTEIPLFSGEEEMIMEFNTPNGTEVVVEIFPDENSTDEIENMSDQVETTPQPSNDEVENENPPTDDTSDSTEVDS